jgi:hypothetical protein
MELDPADRRGRGVPLGIAAGNLVTAVPASVAARTRPAALLRAE